MSVVAVFHAVSAAELDAFLKEPAALEAFLDSAKAVQTYQVMAIAYLLKQINPFDFDFQSPLSKVLESGTETAVEAGYGPVRYLRADDVVAIARALSAVSTEQFAEGFDAEAMERERIEPVLDESEWLSSLLRDYEALVNFYQQAAAENKAVLQYEF